MPIALLPCSPHLTGAHAKDGAILWRRRRKYCCGSSARFALAAKSHLLGKLRARLRVVRGDHRITRIEAPLLAVLVGREPVMGHQVPFQGLELLSILEADDVFVMNRFLRIDGWL